MATTDKSSQVNVRCLKKNIAAVAVIRSSVENTGQTTKSYRFADVGLVLKMGNFARKANNFEIEGIVGVRHLDDGVVVTFEESMLDSEVEKHISDACGRVLEFTPTSADAAEGMLLAWRDPKGSKAELDARRT